MDNETIAALLILVGWLVTIPLVVRSVWRRKGGSVERIEEVCGLMEAYTEYKKNRQWSGRLQK